MAGRTPQQAVEAFVEPIREALGCFARGRLSASKYRADEYGVLTFNKGEIFPLGSNGAVSMELSMQYRVVQAEGAKGPWKVTTTAWIYVLNTVDASSFEFHFHPVGDSHSKRPHVHIDKGRVHVPTGRILIEDVLDLALELGGDCLEPDKWAALSERNRENFGLGATWGVHRPVDGGEPMPRRP